MHDLYSIAGIRLSVLNRLHIWKVLKLHRRVDLLTTIAEAIAENKNSLFPATIGGVGDI